MLLSKSWFVDATFCAIGLTIFVGMICKAFLSEDIHLNVY